MGGHSDELVLWTEVEGVVKDKSRVSGSCEWWVLFTEIKDNIKRVAALVCKTR